ncbi:MAG: serine/threonine protein kinase [Polyangiaceae bacterium]|nr:serine/threonine protein kinase [Polyangiaceae bacterium]
MAAHLQSTGAARGAPWAAGSLIGARYRLTAPIGAGAMGEVWRAEHVTLGTPCAVKLVDLAAQQDPQEALGRFLQEARAAAGLVSPHVVRILDHGANGEIAYIAMELLEGESLAARLARERALAPAELMKVVRGVALAMDRAHERGILHRDIKPANIFFARVEGREVVKVLDFGIAKVIRPGDREAIVETQAGLVMGTPAYKSPEQVRGQPLDPRSDLWQLGVITFECLCGRLPWSGASLGDLFVRICSGDPPVPSSVAEVPECFDAWFARAVRRDKAQRFASALELSSALEPILGRGAANTSGPVDALEASGIRPGPAEIRAAPRAAELDAPRAAELDAPRAAELDAAPPDRRVLRLGLLVAAAFAVTLAGLTAALLLGRDEVAGADAAPSAPLLPPPAPPAQITADPVEPAAPAPAREAPAAAPTARAPSTRAPSAGPGAPKVRSPRTRERQVEEDLAL